MFENKSYINIKEGTERSFGLIFAVFFAIIGLYPLWFGNNIHLWSCIIAFIFLFLGLFLPKVLTVPNQLWFKLSKLLGIIVTPIIIILLYFLTVTPIGIIMRLLGKDLLRKKFDKSVNSYWIKRNKSSNSMNNQF